MLLTIVNDILDLATVDAGIMQLDIAEVRIDRTLAAAAELVADRLEEHSIRLAVETAQAPEELPWRRDARAADPLQSAEQRRELCAGRQHHHACPAGRSMPGVEFSVHDDGPGMPPEVLDTVFRRFEPRVNGGRRRGAGLGLSIVKSFVELHGGSVAHRNRQDLGTTVICLFPIAPSGMRAAAE